MTDDSTSISDAKLRDGRMVFYEEAIAQIDRVLSEFLRKAGARSAFLAANHRRTYVAG